jgi:hypothetical protein
MPESRLNWPRVRVWKVNFKGVKTPIGRFLLDPRDRRVLVEAGDAVSKRLLETIAAEGVRDYDTTLVKPADGLRFLESLQGGLAFRPGLRAGRVEGAVRAASAAEGPSSAAGEAKPE